MKKKGEKDQCVCTCGSPTPCCVHTTSQGACTCGTGTPCCVHEKKGGQKETKMYRGCCEPNCGPGICK